MSDVLLLAALIGIVAIGVAAGLWLARIWRG